MLQQEKYSFACQVWDLNSKSLIGESWNFTKWTTASLFEWMLARIMSNYPILALIGFNGLKIVSVIFCSLLNVGLPPRYPQAVWCHWGEIEPFSATPAQARSAEWDQLRKIPWNPSRRGIEPGPQRGQTVRCIQSFIRVERKTKVTSKLMRGHRLRNLLI